MATKTISIELDVYQKLKSLKKDSRESFSQVLRRASWEENVSTGASILEWLEKRRKSKMLLDNKVLDALDKAQEKDFAPENKWSKK